MIEPQQKIPVFILTGFLGAGKTSLLNEALQHDSMHSSAIIINEFGETGLDHHFIEAGDEDVIELSNGCLCCTIRGKLIDTVTALPLDRIKRIIIETTGLANPAPVLQSIIGHPEIAEKCRIAAVLTLVDILNAPLQLESHDEACLQIALADRIILTKTDMLEGADRDERIAMIQGLVRKLNPAAEIVLRQSSDDSSGFFSDDSIIMSPVSGKLLQEGTGIGHSSASHHGESIISTSLTSSKPLKAQAIYQFCELLTSAHAENLLRIKGLVEIENSDKPLVLHGVHGVLHEPEFLEKWPPQISGTQIVVITRNMKSDFIIRLFAGFTDMPMPDTPDRAALTQNPLAIPGQSR
jgi:G3E family GTPase